MISIDVDSGSKFLMTILFSRGLNWVSEVSLVPFPVASLISVTEVKGAAPWWVWPSDWGYHSMVFSGNKSEVREIPSGWDRIFTYNYIIYVRDVCRTNFEIWLRDFDIKPPRRSWSSHVHAVAVRPSFWLTISPLSRQETPNSGGGQKEMRRVVVMMKTMTHMRAHESTHMRAHRRADIWEHTYERT